MQHKPLIIFMGFLAFLSTLYGCAGLQKGPLTKNYFDLSNNRPVSSRNNITKGNALLVKELFINPAFDSHSFVYRIGKNRYTTDYYNEFISYPAKLITVKITETLCATRYFKSAQTNMKQNVGYRLSGKITRLYADFQDTNNPEAIIEIRLVLEKRTGHTFQTISGKTYLAKEHILSRKPAHLVSGWNTGLTKIVAQFISEFQNPDDHA